MGDSRRQYSRLARTRAGQDQDRAFGAAHGLELFGVEAVKHGGIGRAARAGQFTDFGGYRFHPRNLVRLMFHSNGFMRWIAHLCGVMQNGRKQASGRPCSR